jgi:Holliday junction resolvase-like predicted endonuclease
MDEVKKKRINSKRVGTAAEYRSMAIFEEAGYETMRSHRSWGTWDFVAWNATSIAFVQVKTRDWPSGEEMEAIKMATVPHNAAKIIHRWVTARSTPDVRLVP